MMLPSARFWCARAARDFTRPPPAAARSYTVGFVHSMGCEVLALNVRTAGHPPAPGGRSSVSNVAGMLNCLRGDAESGARAVRAGQVCAWEDGAGMPQAMLVAPAAADVRRFFDKCVCDRHGDVPLLVLVPLSPDAAALAAASPGRCHDLLRDSVVHDMAGHPPAAGRGGRGRRRGRRRVSRGRVARAAAAAAAGVEEARRLRAAAPAGGSERT